MLAGLEEPLVVTVEDNMLAGGFGSLVAERFAEDTSKRVKIFGYGDKFIGQGGIDELMDDCGLSPEAIAAYIEKNI